MPALRFLEFQREAGWEIQPLRQLAKLIEDRAGTEKYTLLSVTSGVGLVTQIEKFGREIAGDQYKNYFAIRRGDFAYNKSATKKDPEGFVALLESYEKAAVPNSIFTCFRLKDERNSPLFFKHLFSTNIHGNWLRKFITIGARANGSLNIDSNDLLSLPLGVPTSSEQRKIADCLSSLDDLIAAQAKKIESLKAHKKGLMQQLFPAEGETLPILRFPEFENAQGWVKTTLGKVATFKKGKGISKAETSSTGVQPCIRYGELYTHYHEIIDTVISYTNVPSDELVLSQENDVIIPASGETEIDIATASCVLKSGIALGGDLNIIRSKINGVFLSYYLNNAKKQSIAKLAQGISVVHLYSNQLKTLAINIPENSEQKKIADCLSAIDDRVMAQAKKLEALKTQKQGLMQGLFPSMTEAEA